MSTPFSCALSRKKYNLVFLLPDLLMPVKIIGHTPHGSSLLLVSGTLLPHLTTAFFLQDPWRVHQVYQWGNAPLPLSLLSHCAKHFVFLPGPIPPSTNIYPLGDGHKLEGKAQISTHMYVVFGLLSIWISTSEYLQSWCTTRWHFNVNPHLLVVFRTL